MTDTAIEMLRRALAAGGKGATRVVLLADERSRLFRTRSDLVIRGGDSAGLEPSGGRCMLHRLHETL